MNKYLKVERLSLISQRPEEVEVKCMGCGATVLRNKQRANLPARCFTCKEKRTNENNKKHAH